MSGLTSKERDVRIPQREHEHLLYISHSRGDRYRFGQSEWRIQSGLESAVMRTENSKEQIILLYIISTERTVNDCMFNNSKTVLQESWKVVPRADCRGKRIVKRSALWQVIDVSLVKQQPLFSGEQVPFMTTVFHLFFARLTFIVFICVLINTFLHSTLLLNFNVCGMQIEDVPPPDTWFCPPLRLSYVLMCLHVF